MNYKTLLGSVLLIALIATGAYIGLNTDTPQSASVEPLSMEEKNEEMDTTLVSDVTREESPTDVPTESVVEEEPKVALPATAPRVTPPEPVVVEDPAPTPVSSGYTLAEVRLHSNASSCWSIINGSVYDLTAFVSKHPGGEKKILRICGVDGTSAYEEEHGGDSKTESILSRYFLGEYSG
jgi:hypothetical protein